MTESRPGTDEALTGELVCRRCGGSNIWSWHAPAPLWNAVMRATGLEDKWQIVCPVCFSQLAEDVGYREVVWCLTIEDLDLTTLPTPDGFRWDADQHFVDQTKALRCEGWICEAHPQEHWPHEIDGKQCGGAGMLCAHSEQQLP